MLFLSGGSAGGHLATIAGLTQNEPRYQPGFEDASSSVTAVAPPYGWYGGYSELGAPTSEGGVLGPPADDAPPFFIAHGTEDSAAPSRPHAASPPWVRTRSDDRSESPN